VDEALWHAEPPLADLNPFWSMTLDSVWAHVDEFDVIHSHLDYWGFPLANQAPVPVLTTLHGRLDVRELQWVYRRFRDVPLVSISDAQRAPVPWANFLATIYHGIDLDQFTFNPRPESHLAFLGRIAPEKGLDTAIRVAKRAGRLLRVAAREPLRHGGDANVHADRRHYQHEVKPLLDRRNARLIGEVDGPQKDEFLRSSAALLFPIRWPEPFGLVMVEALACGTPVIAFRQGSVPEIIEHGVTGFICDDEDDMVDAVRRIDEIDRARCRQIARERFSVARMAGEYAGIYSELVDDFDTAPLF